MNNVDFSHRPFLWKDEGKSDDERGDTYFSKPRIELFKAIDWPGRLMLDVGCGTGATSAALKEKFPDTEYYGIEMNSRMSAIASEKLDTVLCLDFEETIGNGVLFSDAKFDTVLFADVLEHMFNPWKVLEKTRGILADDAKVVASIPNICNYQVLDNLSRGIWNYDKWGILDFTHIRFFSFKSIMKMFFETGYKVEMVYGLPLDTSLTPSIINSNSTTIETDTMIFKKIDGDSRIQFGCLQFVVVAKKA